VSCCRHGLHGGSTESEGNRGEGRRGGGPLGSDAFANLLCQDLPLPAMLRLVLLVCTRNSNCPSVLRIWQKMSMNVVKGSRAHHRTIIRPAGEVNEKRCRQGTSTLYGDLGIFSGGGQTEKLYTSQQQKTHRGRPFQSANDGWSAPTNVGSGIKSPSLSL